ncbi:MAG: hypothetical protein USCAAHI_01795 [Beijerinckiaceae bacterium]|nr:MAG: hypothetical protein USCAAHI_01795 [Beijerinckiaceae bacterium]
MSVLEKYFYMRKDKWTQTGTQRTGKVSFPLHTGGVPYRPACQVKPK